MLGILLEDLLDEMAVKYPHFAEIVRLGYQGMPKKEILQQLPVRKSQAYRIYNDCRKYVEEYLKK